MKEKISITIEDKLLKSVEEHVDGIKIRNRSQAIENLLRKGLGENKTAAILVGGRDDINYIDGELRFIKEINGAPLIEKNIKKLKKEGFNKIYIIGKENVITEIFSVIKNGKKYGLDIEYIEENKARGSFSSLKEIRGEINTPLLVLYGDVYTEANFNLLWNTHVDNKFDVTLLLTATDEPQGSGTVSLEGEKVTDFKQKPKSAEEFIIFSSAFITNPNVLEYEGNSIEEDLFPELIDQDLVGGYITSKKRIHVN